MAEMPLKDLAESATSTGKHKICQLHSMIITVLTQPAKPVFLGFSAPPMKTPENPAFGFGTLLALHLPGDEVAFVITHFSLNLFTLPQEKLNLSPMEVAAYEEVSNYLADIGSYSWISGAPTLSSDGQTALTIALLRLTLKLDSIAVSLFTNSETAAATPLRVMRNFQRTLNQ